MNQSNDDNLQFFNGLGGFSKDGSEYIIHLKEMNNTPAPWVNIIANEHFGFVISEVGSGYTWLENAHEFRLTPWSNDPIKDPITDCIYIQNTDTGELWSPTLLPIRHSNTYTVKHGFGYSKFEYEHKNIATSLTAFVPLEDSVKLNLLNITNLSDETQNFTLTYYMNPVLGEDEDSNSKHIQSEVDEFGNVLFNNNFSEEYSDCYAYIKANLEHNSYTCDRRNFFGDGGRTNPQALRESELDGTVGSGFDPCGAIQVKISLLPQQTQAVVFQLGASNNLDTIKNVSAKYTNLDTVSNELHRVQSYWQDKLGVIKVKTADSSFDLLMNGWLQYQTLSSRLLARTGFYQSGGAFGYRDQLQDVLSLVYTHPSRVKDQIILHAQHQFEEGDVQHWWHSIMNKGVRTRITDDRLWLPYLVFEYIKSTQDYSILEVEVPFLKSPILAEDEVERYESPQISETVASVYEHCLRSIDISLQFGIHGLPLMGSGDWNDGMNMIGVKGKGESVWLGWFLLDVLNKMISLCKHQNDPINQKRFEDAITTLQQSLEANAWDGKWYKRAFFDDGGVIGSSLSDDCKIDSISQSWAVISGYADKERIQLAMHSLEEYLVDRKIGIIKLLTPPFDQGSLNPGYIKNYVPGVRENGGQYTHAAIWVIIAYSKINESNKAIELFNMINPINHSSNYRDMLRYRNEPYVLSADVYSNPQHLGMGGWSWYTGAASWMYVAGLQHILGFVKEGNLLKFDPVIPKQWDRYSLEYLYQDTKYIFEVTNSLGSENSIIITHNGETLSNDTVNLVNDKSIHHVQVAITYK